MLVIILVINIVTLGEEPPALSMTASAFCMSLITRDTTIGPTGAFAIAAADVWILISSVAASLIVSARVDPGESISCRPCGAWLLITSRSQRWSSRERGRVHNEGWRAGNSDEA